MGHGIIGKIYTTPSVAVKNLSRCSGDTLLAGLVVEYLRSKNIDKAIHFGNKCATGVVSKKGVSTIEMKDLEELEMLEDHFIDYKCSEEELKNIMDR